MRRHGPCDTSQAPRSTLPVRHTATIRPYRSVSFFAQETVAVPMRSARASAACWPQRYSRPVGALWGGKAWVRLPSSGHTLGRRLRRGRKPTAVAAARATPAASPKRRRMRRRFRRRLYWVRNRTSPQFDPLGCAVLTAEASPMASCQSVNSRSWRRLVLRALRPRAARRALSANREPSHRALFPVQERGRSGPAVAPHRQFRCTSRGLGQHLRRAAASAAPASRRVGVPP
jgi:hypothetical protein